MPIGQWFSMLIGQMEFIPNARNLSISVVYLSISDGVPNISDFQILLSCNGGSAKQILVWTNSKINPSFI